MGRRAHEHRLFWTRPALPRRLLALPVQRWLRARDQSSRRVAHLPWHRSSLHRVDPSKGRIVQGPAVGFRASGQKSLALRPCFVAFSGLSSMTHIDAGWLGDTSRDSIMHFLDPE